MDSAILITDTKDNLQRLVNNLVLHRKLNTINIEIKVKIYKKMFLTDPNLHSRNLNRHKQKIYSSPLLTTGVYKVHVLYNYFTITS